MKIHKNIRGQAVLGEYVMVIFVVLGMMSVSTVLVKRAIQARVNDAANVMVDIVRDRAGSGHVGLVYQQYEEYYSNTTSLVSRDFHTKTQVLPGGSSGLFRKTIDEKSAVRTFSNVADSGKAY